MYVTLLRYVHKSRLGCYFRPDFRVGSQIRSDFCHRPLEWPNPPSESSTRNSGCYNLCRIHVGLQDLRTAVALNSFTFTFTSWHRPKQPFLPRPQRQRQALLLHADKYLRDEDLETVQMLLLNRRRHYTGCTDDFINIIIILRLNW